MSSISDSSKKRGRPPTGIGKPMGLRIYPSTARALDLFIANQGGKISRPEAIRLLVREALAARGFLDLDEE